MFSVFSAVGTAADFPRKFKHPMMIAKRQDPGLTAHLCTADGM
jgi:hypothetical protein